MAYTIVEPPSGKFTIVEPPQKDEGLWKDAARKIMMPVIGKLRLRPENIMAELMELFGTGEAAQTLNELDPERIAELRKKFPTAPWPEEGKELPWGESPEEKVKYMQDFKEKTAAFPTVPNLAAMAEDLTGMPLKPKSSLDEILQLVGGGFGLKPGDWKQKIMAGLKTGGAAGVMEGMGVPKWASDLLGIIYGQHFKAPEITMHPPDVPLEPLGVPPPSGELPTGGDGDSISLIKRIFGEGKERRPLEGLTKSLYPELQAFLEKNLPSDMAETTATEDVARGVLKQPPPGATNRPLGGKATIGRGFGLQVTPRPTTPGKAFIEDEIGDVFSRQRFENKTDAGTRILRDFQQRSLQTHREVGLNYENTRQLNNGIEAPHPDLVDVLQRRLDELDAVPELSTPDSQRARIMRRMVDRLTIRDPETGVITGYRPMSNQALIDQQQNVRRHIDHNFKPGEAKNIFRTITNDIQDALELASQNAGRPEAFDSLQVAGESMRDWADTYDNPNVTHLRDPANTNYIKTYDEFLNVDKFNQLEAAIGDTPRGRVYLDGLKRDLVQKELSEFTKDLTSPRKLDAYGHPKEIDTRSLDKKLSELQPIITPEQTNQVRQLVQRYREAPIKQKVTAPKPKIEKPTLKYDTAKKIRESFKNRESIREARKEFEKIEGGKEIYEKFSEQHIKDMSHKRGRTGNDLVDFLDNRDNYESLSELIGEDNVKAMREEARIEGNKALDKDKMLKVSKGVARIALPPFALKLLRIFLGF